MKGPPIFNLLLNWGLELAERFKNISLGFTLQHRQSSSQLDYADDIAGMDRTVAGLQVQETADNIAKYCGLELEDECKENRLRGHGNWERYVTAPTPRD